MPDPNHDTLSRFVETTELQQLRAENHKLKSELSAIRKAARGLLNELAAVDAVDTMRAEWGNTNAACLQLRIDELYALTAVEMTREKLGA